MLTQAELHFLTLAIGHMSRDLPNQTWHFSGSQIESVTGCPGGLALMSDDGSARGKLLVKLATTCLHNDSHEVAVFRGEALAKLLMLTKKDNGRYDTIVGDKTPTGLLVTVERLFTDVNFTDLPEFKKGG